MSMDKQKIIQALKEYDEKPIRIMEVCGTHTNSIFKSGIRSMLPPSVSLISGPGCPVCVTSAAYIDKCLEHALKPQHILVTFGDMMKVTGSSESLSDKKGDGAKVRLMYSPMEILPEAAQNRDITYVIAAVGFETTAPAYALLLSEAIANGIKNIKFLTAIKTVIPALHQICRDEKNIDAFICPGHVSTIIGSEPYHELSDQYKKPFVVTGFEPEHILVAIYDIICQLREGKHEVHNFYKNAVQEKGNRKAHELLAAYFEEGGAMWRGLGKILHSGLYIKEEYADYDAGSRKLDEDERVPEGCRCGEVVLGRINPNECPLFGCSCTPLRPYGPCMVSGEGACGIWYKNVE